MPKSTKSTNPLLRRAAAPASPFSTARRPPAGSRKTSRAERDDASARLDDTGLTPSLAPSGVEQDVVSLVRYVHQHTFEEMPARAAGMNSEQISRTLRLRARLPPVVSVAHLHALSRSTTETERELARLVAAGRVRKVTIPGRGKGGSAVGEGVAVVGDWKERLRREPGIEAEAKEKYMRLMDAHPASATAPVASLSPVEIQTLVSAGFLTNPGSLASPPGGLFARSTGTSTGTSTGAISKAGSLFASGTLAAVGGSGAIHTSGGGGSTLATRDNRPSLAKPGQEMTFSLPATGSYLTLLTEARLRLLHLLTQLSPRYKEATKVFLEEKWNGNVPSDPVSRQKRMRGEWSGVLPGKTKRWRDFWGLEFEWVLAECVGGGLVEVFDTGVGVVGVRGT